MFSEVVGKRFIVRVPDSSKIAYKHVEVVTAILNEYFDDEAYEKAVSTDVASIGAQINNRMNYISFVTSEVETGKIIRISEHQLVYNVTGKTDEDISLLFTKLKSNNENQEFVQKFGEIGLDSHYIKCIDCGMSILDSLKSIKKMIDNKIKILKQDGDSGDI